MTLACEGVRYRLQDILQDLPAAVPECKQLKCTRVSIHTSKFLDITVSGSGPVKCWFEVLFRKQHLCELGI